MSTEVEIGQKVNIYWEHIKCECEVEVRHIPCSTGDSWILKRKDGTVIYVNNFGKMVALSDKTG